ncbi:MAG: ATP-binding protein [Candidatus Accumulibacter sp.]|jgi:hypothetical protein|nr:ATP-binding protein [Accumulibacter sp.]
MDPIINPFSPGAGAPPPELVGRDAMLDQARILLGRVKHKRPEKSLIITGLRGVGKTVLLNEINRMARAEGYQSLLLETREDKTLADIIYQPLRSLLFELDRLVGAGNKVRRGLAVLRSFIGSLKITVCEASLDIEPARGAADSGDIEADLPNLFVAIAEAAEERQTAVALLIDEIQYLSTQELGALIMAMHQMQQRQLPLVLVGAGLPILPGMAGELKTYSERLFNFSDVGALSEAEVFQALREPVRLAGVDFDDDALHEIYRLTCGYPYFVQEWGYQAWNRARQSQIALDVIHEATTEVALRLDQNFFRVRFDRLTPREKNFLRVMAALPAPRRTGEIAAALGTRQSSTATMRHKLIRKGMIFSPAYGELAFSVPLFDDFMRRTMPEQS